VQTYKKKTLTNFTAKPLLVPIFQNGECVYETPNIEEIKRYCSSQLELIWDEVKRFENPHEYYVDLSKSLWDVKQKLLNENF
jgi:nicotinate phosphoribosyltransferase